MKKTKTLRVRVKDNHAAQLRRMARSVNTVWNYVNELSERAIRERGLFLSAFDLQKYVQGSNKELGLHSHTRRAMPPRANSLKTWTIARNLLICAATTLAMKI